MTPVPCLQKLASPILMFLEGWKRQLPSIILLAQWSHGH